MPRPVMVKDRRSKTREEERVPNERLNVSSNLLITIEKLDAFWIQLYKNIGYSEEYHKSVIVEPICALLGENDSVRALKRLDLLVCKGYRGRHAADFIDRERSEFLEQWLLPYILDEKGRCIVIPNETPSERENEDEYPPRIFLRSLLTKPQKAKVLLGLLHYHVDEPKLSARDARFMRWFAERAKKLGASNQIGMVLSEREPADSLSLRQEASKVEFIKHMRHKLRMGKIDLTANLFDGSETFHPQVRVGVKGIAR
jgi:hypothetical protein